jgi:hypothetical protein
MRNTFSKKQLAAIIGVSRSTFTRQFRDFINSDSDFVKYKNSSILPAFVVENFCLKYGYTDLLRQIRSS